MSDKLQRWSYDGDPSDYGTWYSVEDVDTVIAEKDARIVELETTLRADLDDLQQRLNSLRELMKTE